jgi:hypothetical protein
MFTDRMGTLIDLEQSESRVAFAAGPETDFFRDPASEANLSSAPFLSRPAPQQFTLTVRARPELASTYDAAALLLYADREHWVKLACELTDMGYPAIVSVVTRGRSDDCNGEPQPAGEARLRLSRRGNTLGLYYAAADGWKMHRLLTVPAPIRAGGERGPQAADLRVGFSVQSPTGAGCRAVFDEIEWREEPVTDFRTGTLSAGTAPDS